MKNILHLSFTCFQNQFIYTQERNRCIASVDNTFSHFPSFLHTHIIYSFGFFFFFLALFHQLIFAAWSCQLYSLRDSTVQNPSYLILSCLQSTQKNSQFKLPKVRCLQMWILTWGGGGCYCFFNSRSSFCVYSDFWPAAGFISNFCAAHKPSVAVTLKQPAMFKTRWDSGCQLGSY